MKFSISLDIVSGLIISRLKFTSPSMKSPFSQRLTDRSKIEIPSFTLTLSLLVPSRFSGIEIRDSC